MAAQTCETLWQLNNVDASEDTAGQTTVQLNGVTAEEVNLGCSFTTQYHVHHHHVTPEKPGQSALTDTRQVFTEQAKFLRHIQPQFILDVKPSEDGVLDQLREAGVLDSEEEHEVHAKHETEDQARALWIALHKVPVKVFGEKVVPLLATVYPHVLQGATFAHRWVTKATQCVRHFLMNSAINAIRFADVLVPTQACTLDEYSEILESEETEERKWETVFSFFARKGNPADDEEPLAEFENLESSVLRCLEDLGLIVPENFREIMYGGFPCSCCPQLKKKIKKQRRRRTSGTSSLDGRKAPEKQKDNVIISGDVNSRRSSSSSDYPASTSSEEDANTKGTTDQSHTGSSAEETIVQEATSAEATVFTTQEERMKFITLIEKLNHAIRSASSVKQKSLELEGIKETISVLAERPSRAEPASDANADLGKIIRLLKTAEQLHSDMRASLAVAQKVTDSATEDESWIPMSRKNMLQNQRFALVNEMNEAAKYWRRSVAVVEGIKKSLPSGLGFRFSPAFADAI